MKHGRDSHGWHDFAIGVAVMAVVIFVALAVGDSGPSAPADPVCATYGNC